MELTKKNLEAVRFTAKGRWYLGEQVDSFIDSVVEAAAKLLKEKEELTKELEQKKQELTKTAETGKVKPAEEDCSVVYQVMICDELVKERNKLIEEIKTLRKEKTALQSEETA